MLAQVMPETRDANFLKEYVICNSGTEFNQVSYNIGEISGKIGIQIRKAGHFKTFS